MERGMSKRFVARVMSRVAPARMCAYDVLRKVDTNGAYAHVALRETMERRNLPAIDAALASELVSGVLKMRRLLDDTISRHSRIAFSKLDPRVIVILRMSIYQIAFLSRIPDYAAVADGVEMAKQAAPRAAGFVNAVLRSLLRGKDWRALWSELPDPLPHRSDVGLHLSYPDFLVDHFCDSYGDHFGSGIMLAQNRRSGRTLRINSARCTRDEVIALLAAEGVAAEESPVSPFGVRLPPGVNPSVLRAYTTGMCSIQGESSMLVAPLLGPLDGKRVLDACAAPGGKALHMAELAGDHTAITAVDIHAHRAATIRRQANRLRLQSVRAVAADARSVEGEYDAVLLDAPCSGLGTIGRHPDIKWRTKAEEMESLAALQKDLLDAMAERVRPGGVLLYTTCTLSPAENTVQIERFLERRSDFSALPISLPVPPDTRARPPDPVGQRHIWPQDFGSDGFFIAKLQRRE